MRPLLRILLPLVLAGGGLLALWTTGRARAEALALRAERAGVKREFVERAAAARALATGRPREAADEAVALLRWYFEELQAARNRHPGAGRDPSLAELLSQRPHATEPERRTLADFHALAAARLEALRAGRHAPLQVAGAAGLRLDLLAVEAGEAPTGGRGVRLDMALWGAPRRTEREAAGGRGPGRAAFAVAFPRLALRFADGAGRPWGEMTGAGEPYLRLGDPERFFEEFPPGLLFATWWVERFPREAARVAIALEAQVPGAGGATVPASFAFDLPVAEAWRLPAGEPFGGAAREDPSLAPAPGAGR